MGRDGDVGGDAALEAEALGGMLWYHRLQPAIAASAIGIDPTAVAAMIAGRPLSLTAAQRERAGLLLNILVRFEVRLNHDSAAIRQALDRPLDDLGGRTPAQALTADVEQLRRVRMVVSHMPLPKIRMWRVAATYG